MAFVKFFTHTSIISNQLLLEIDLIFTFVIKNEIYVSLVRQSEQARIQATMESMDIQVIDKANLPIQKSAPRRTLITLGGMGVGIVICLIYGFWMYRKEEM